MIERRLAFVTNAFHQAGFDAISSANRARLSYLAHYVPLVQIGQPRMTHEEFEDYIRDFIETLIPR